MALRIKTNPSCTVPMAPMFQQEEVPKKGRAISESLEAQGFIEVQHVERPPRPVSEQSGNRLKYEQSVRFTQPADIPPIIPPKAPTKSPPPKPPVRKTAPKPPPKPKVDDILRHKQNVAEQNLNDRYDVFSEVFEEVLDNSADRNRHISNQSVGSIDSLGSISSSIGQQDCSSPEVKVKRVEAICIEEIPTETIDFDFSPSLTSPIITRKVINKDEDDNLKLWPTLPFTLDQLNQNTIPNAPDTSPPPVPRFGNDNDNINLPKLPDTSPPPVPKDRNFNYSDSEEQTELSSPDLSPTPLPKFTPTSHKVMYTCIPEEISPPLPKFTPTTERQVQRTSTFKTVEISDSPPEITGHKISCSPIFSQSYETTEVSSSVYSSPSVDSDASSDSQQYSPTFKKKGILVNGQGAVPVTVHNKHIGFNIPVDVIEEPQEVQQQQSSFVEEIPFIDDSDDGSLGGSDKWSIQNEYGSEMSGTESAFTVSDSNPDIPNHGYENVVINDNRTRSQIARTQRNDYENVELDHVDHGFAPPVVPPRPQSEIKPHDIPPVQNHVEIEIQQQHEQPVQRQIEMREHHDIFQQRVEVQQQYHEEHQIRPQSEIQHTHDIIHLPLRPHSEIQHQQNYHQHNQPSHKIDKIEIILPPERPSSELRHPMSDTESSECNSLPARPPRASDYENVDLSFFTEAASFVQVYPEEKPRSIPRTIAPSSIAVDLSYALEQRTATLERYKQQNELQNIQESKTVTEEQYVQREEQFVQREEQYVPRNTELKGIDIVINHEKSQVDSSDDSSSECSEPTAEKIDFTSGFDSSDFEDQMEAAVGHEEDDDQISLLSEGSQPRSPTSPMSADGDKKVDVLYEIISELLQTERAYVDRLHFLCRVVLLNLNVLNNVQDIHNVPPDVVKQIFANVEIIFTFHVMQFLPRIEERIKDWKRVPRIGDVMKILLPFLKLYTEYMEKFKESQTLFDIWLQKDAIFASLVREVERIPECHRLTVKQHMLSIVQRVPKYQSLLRDYLDNLPDTGDERKDIEEALESINSTAHHLDRAMSKDDRMNTLKELQQKLDTSVNFVKATKELIKEGKIKTIGAKSGSKFERYIFLLNDSILICTLASLGSKHKVQYIMEVDGMQLHDGDSLEVPHTFYAQSKLKVVEFFANSRENKMEWVETIRRVIDDYTKWKLSGYMISGHQQENDNVVGKRVPTMDQVSKATSCHLCGSNFGAMKRKHSCKGCGHVVCAKCCRQKMGLEFDQNRLNKVCDECYIILRKREMNLGADEWQTSQVTAQDPSKMSGQLQICTHYKKSWSKRWFSVHEDGTLYCFKTDKDTAPWSSLPLKRFKVNVSAKGDAVYKATVFKLSNSKKSYYFQSPDQDVMYRWMEALADFADSEA